MHILRSYRSGALRRGHEWGLTDDEFDQLTSAACFYCDALPSTVFRSGKNNGEFVYNGIDRVNNRRGYVPGNVVSCCKLCNLAKGRLSYADFIEWILRLGEKQFNTLQAWEEKENFTAQLLLGDNDDDEEP